MRASSSFFVRLITLILVFYLCCSGDIRNKLGNDKSRVICRCPLELLHDAVTNISVKGRYYQLHDLEDFHPCMTSSLFGPDRFRSDCHRANSLNNVTFVMMTGSGTQIPRVEGQVLKTWASSLDVRSRLVMISDQADERLGIITLPEVQGKSSYDDAQHRQLQFITKYLKSHALWASTEWVFMVDDDTFVNIDRLRRFLDRFDARLSLAFGYVFGDGVDISSAVNMRLKFGWFSGGAGMLLSRPVVEYLMDNIYTSKQCPFDWFNDKTVSVCTKTKDDAIHVHSSQFNAWKNVGTSVELQYFNKLNLPSLRDVITAHYSTDMLSAYACLDAAENAVSTILSNC